MGARGRGRIGWRGARGRGRVRRFCSGGGGGSDGADMAFVPGQPVTAVVVSGDGAGQGETGTAERDGTERTMSFVPGQPVVMSGDGKGGHGVPGGPAAIRGMPCRAGMERGMPAVPGSALSAVSRWRCRPVAKECAKGEGQGRGRRCRPGCRRAEVPGPRAEGAAARFAAPPAPVTAPAPLPAPGAVRSPSREGEQRGNPPGRRDRALAGVARVSLEKRGSESRREPRSPGTGAELGAVPRLREDQISTCLSGCGLGSRAFKVR